MNQQQKIGSSNQQQGLTGNQKHQIKPIPEKTGPVSHQPEKPAVTDDAGNPVNKKHEDAGKGYSEMKQTEPGSYVTSEMEAAKITAPEKQNKQGKNVYGEKEPGILLENLHEQNELPHQHNQEGKEAHEKRIRQSENVPG